MIARSLYLKFFIVSAFIVMSSFVCSAQSTGIKIIDDGLDQLKKGNNEKAIDIFLQALEKYPNNATVDHNLADAYQHIKKLDLAVFYYTKAISADAQFVEAYINRALVYYEMKDSVKAEADERKAMSFKPGYAVAFANHGYILLMRGKYNESIAYFDSAIAINKYLYTAYTNKAGALSDLNRHNEALELLDYLISLKPTNLALAYYNRGNEYYEIGEWLPAYTDCEKAIELDSKDAGSYILRSKIKDEMGDDKSAVEDCTIAISLDSTNAKYYDERALRRFDLKDQEGIINDCNKSIALDPNHFLPYLQRGDAYDELGRFDEAINDYDKAMALAPNEFKIYRERAGTAYKLKDYQGALRFINKALSIQPNDQYMLGHKYNIYLHDLKDVNSAIATLDQCIKVSTDTAASFYYLAKANLLDSLKNHTAACKSAFEALVHGAIDGYDFIEAHHCEEYKKNPRVLATPLFERSVKELDAGNYQAAIATLTQLIALLPDTAGTYLNRGMTYRKLDKFNEAIVDYTKAISLNPKLTQAIICRAVAKTYLEDFEGAKKDYLLSIKTDPQSSSIAYHNYGLFIAETEPEKALEYFTNAIRIDRKYAKAYLSRGMTYIILSRKEEACRDFDKAYELGVLEAKAKSLLYCK